MAITGCIYIDGPNASGKSFLSKAILKRFKGREIHCTYRFGHDMVTYHMAALRRVFRYSENELVIINRNWISEDIYAETFRGGTKWPHIGRLFQKLTLKHAVF